MRRPHRAPCLFLVEIPGLAQGLNSAAKALLERGIRRALVEVPDEEPLAEVDYTKVKVKSFYITQAAKEARKSDPEAL